MLSIIAANGYWSNWSSSSVGLCGASACTGEGLASGEGEALGDGDAASPGLGDGTADAATATGLGLGLGTAACGEGGGGVPEGVLDWQAVTNVSRAAATRDTSKPPERKSLGRRLRLTPANKGKRFDSATSVPSRTS